MLGLQYILKLFDITQQELADKLGIKRQNIDSWIRRKRSIPNKYLKILSDYFSISEEYFQREFTEIDKLKLQKIKLINECSKLGLRIEEI